MAQKAPDHDQFFSTEEIRIIELLYGKWDGLQVRTLQDRFPHSERKLAKKTTAEIIALAEGLVDKKFLIAIDAKFRYTINPKVVSLLVFFNTLACHRSESEKTLKKKVRARKKKS